MFPPGHFPAADSGSRGVTAAEDLKNRAVWIGDVRF